MATVTNVFKRGFRGIFKFDGRSSRKDFWSYSLGVISTSILLWFAIAAVKIANIIPIVVDQSKASSGKLQNIQGGNTSSVPMTNYQNNIGPVFTDLLFSISIIALLIILLLCAAAVRRLHDSNKSGYWVVLPIPFLFCGLFMMGSLFRGVVAGGEPDMFNFMFIFINNIVYLIALLTTGIMLLLPGNKFANRFGVREV